MIISPSSWLEISASAFNHNILQYKKVIGGSLLAPVIKSNAYGHGMIEIGQLCEQNNNVAWLCVAKLSEALTLRTHHITKPILILSLIDDDPVVAVGKNIEYACSDYELAYELNKVGKRTNSLVHIHLKLDTGLSRFGTYPNAALSLVKNIKNLPFIRINGIWSHCAESHKADQEFTRSQIEQFDSFINVLKTNNIHIPLKHMGNTAATTAHKLANCNFFRTGLGVYGYWPSESTKIITQNLNANFTLKPIASWKTRILHIKKIPAGHSIGYDRTATTQQDTTIALLPIGYDDGYNPFLANKGIVGIGSSYAPIVGRIAMNIITIDVTHIKDAHKGQEVVLLGNDPQYNALALAHSIQIYNPRYVTTTIHSSIPRIIVT